MFISRCCWSCGSGGSCWVARKEQRGGKRNCSALLVRGFDSKTQIIIPYSLGRHLRLKFLALVPMMDAGEFFWIIASVCPAILIGRDSGLGMGEGIS